MSSFHTKFGMNFILLILQCINTIYVSPQCISHILRHNHDDDVAIAIPAKQKTLQRRTRFNLKYRAMELLLA